MRLAGQRGTGVSGVMGEEDRLHNRVYLTRKDVPVVYDPIRAFLFLYAVATMRASLDFMLNMRAQG